MAPFSEHSGSKRQQKTFGNSVVCTVVGNATLLKAQRLPAARHRATPHLNVAFAMDSRTASTGKTKNGERALLYSFQTFLFVDVHCATGNVRGNARTSRNAFVPSNAAMAGLTATMARMNMIAPPPAAKNLVWRVLLSPN